MHVSPKALLHSYIKVSYFKPLVSLVTTCLQYSSISQNAMYSKVCKLTLNPFVIIHTSNAMFILYLILRECLHTFLCILSKALFHMWGTADDIFKYAIQQCQQHIMKKYTTVSSVCCTDIIDVPSCTVSLEIIIFLRN